MIYTIKTAQVWGNGAGILLTRNDLGKSFIILPSEFKQVIDSLTEQKKAKLIDLLTKEEAQELTEALETFIKKQPDRKIDGILISSCKIFLANLRHISTADTINNITFILRRVQNHAKLVQKLESLTKQREPRVKDVL